MFYSLFKFYIDGFRSMKLGRTLWKIILVKLFVIFAVLKIFLFTNPLQSDFDNDLDRAGHVLEKLTAGSSSVLERSWKVSSPISDGNPQTEVIRD
ncbi:MAG: DUF4492 domain-containing protein [Syntrophobacteria bacterium]